MDVRARAARTVEAIGRSEVKVNSRVDNNHCFALPRFACDLVANAAPVIDDPSAAVINAASATQLVVAGEVFLERVAHGFESGADLSFNNR